MILESSDIYANATLQQHSLSAEPTSVCPSAAAIADSALGYELGAHF